MYSRPLPTPSNTRRGALHFPQPLGFSANGFAVVGRSCRHVTLSPDFLLDSKPQLFLQRQTWMTSLNLCLFTPPPQRSRRPGGAEDLGEKVGGSAGGAAAGTREHPPPTRKKGGAFVKSVRGWRRWRLGRRRRRQRPYYGHARWRRRAIGQRQASGGSTHAVDGDADEVRVHVHVDDLLQQPQHDPRHAQRRGHGHGNGYPRAQRQR